MSRCGHKLFCWPCRPGDAALARTKNGMNRGLLNGWLTPAVGPAVGRRPGAADGPGAGAGACRPSRAGGG